MKKILNRLLKGKAKASPPTRMATPAHEIAVKHVVARQRLGSASAALPSATGKTLEPMSVGIRAERSGSKHVTQHDRAAPEADREMGRQRSEQSESVEMRQKRKKGRNQKQISYI